MNKILGKFSKKDAVDLVVDGYRGTSSVAKYSAEERLEGSRNLLNELIKDGGYKKQSVREQIFEIITESLDIISPRLLEDSVGRWAEVKQFKHGQKVEFTVKSGKVEAFFAVEGGDVKRGRIYDQRFTVSTRYIQIEVYEEVSRLLTGDVDFNELIDAAIEAFDAKYYEMINTAFVAAYNTMPDTNKISTDDTIVEAEFDRLIQIVGSYGKPIILGTGLGLAKLPQQLADQANADIYNNGYVGKYKGVDVIKLDNAVTDETNTEFQMDDSLIYIIPEGKDKIVKVALEGETLIKTDTGADWTENYRLGRRVGTAVVQTHHFGVCKVTSLAKGA